MNAAIASGYAIGPFIAAIMYAITKDDISLDADSSLGFVYNNLWWNRVTSPAWVIIAMIIITGLLLHFFLKEPEKESRELVQDGPSALEGIFSLSTKEKTAFALNCVASFTLPIFISSWEVFAVNLACGTWGWAPDIAAVYVGCVFLLLVPACIVVGRCCRKMSDRDGQLVFALIATFSFFFLWDSHPGSKGVGVVILYTIGSFLMLLGFMVSRGFCWALQSKQVPTQSKGLASIIMFMFYISGRGSGALIADLYKTDVQIAMDDFTRFTWYSWTPQNTYVWSMQIVCAAIAVMWILSYKIMIPAQGSS